MHAFPKKQTVVVGDRILLKCKTDESVRMSSVKWYRNGHRIASNHHANISISTDKDFMHTSILIAKSTLADAGSYSCKFDHIHARTHVNVVAASGKSRQSIHNPGLMPKSTSERSNPETNGSIFDSYKLFAISKSNKKEINTVLNILCLTFCFSISAHRSSLWKIGI